MSRARDGIWTVTTAPLSPDIYTYRLSIDGNTTNDPVNANVVEEFGGESVSGFAVPGALWTSAPPKRGAVEAHVYASTALQRTEPYQVYTPPDYDRERAEPYPVLYLLHGMADVASTWVAKGGADVTLDNLIALNRAVPMVVVMPLGSNGLVETDQFERALIDEIMPRVEAQYRVSTDRHKRAILGYSLGGAESVLIGFHRLSLFGSIGALSGAFEALDDRVSLPKQQAPLDLLYIACGATDPLLVENRRTRDAFDAAGLAVNYVEVPDTGHVWPLWRQGLADVAQMLFRSVPK